MYVISMRHVHKFTASKPCPLREILHLILVILLVPSWLRNVWYVVHGHVSYRCGSGCGIPGISAPGAETDGRRRDILLVLFALVVVSPYRDHEFVHEDQRDGRREGGTELFQRDLMTISMRDV